MRKGKGQRKIGKVMGEFKRAKLRSSSGKKVTNPKQAIAIALSEAGKSKPKTKRKTTKKTATRRKNGRKA